MADIEKVIKALECCTTLGCHHGCPYADKMKVNCTKYLKADALELLKGQEQIINSLKSDLQETLKVVSEQSNVIRCKDCKHYDGDENSRLGTCIENGVCSTPDWFCADGERAE